jgi:hypothetical protein
MFTDYFYFGLPVLFASISWEQAFPGLIMGA